jgi:hypothetical protein
MVNMNLARKLHALAERGIGGEKENAKKKLLEFLLKNDLTLDQLIDEKEDFMIKFKREHRRLITQICFMVIGSDADIWGMRNGKLGIIVNCTKIEHQEILMYYDHYSKAYDVVQEQMFQAFTQAQRIFPDDQEVSDKPLSAEDMKIINLARNINKVNVHKQIEE